MIYNCRHVTGFYDVAFPSSASTYCLLQGVIPSYIHCSNVSLCHSPTLHLHGPPPDKGKYNTQNLVWWTHRWYVTDTINWGFHVNYVNGRRTLILQSPFPHNFFSAARTCVCVALWSFCNMRNKKILSAWQQFSVHGSIWVTRRLRTCAA
jgi:hypothetical protein